MNFKVVDHGADLCVCNIVAGQRGIDTAKVGPPSSPAFTTDPVGSMCTETAATTLTTSARFDLPRPAFAVNRARMNPDTQ